MQLLGFQKVWKILLLTRNCPDFTTLLFFFRATDDELIFEAPEKSSELYYELVKSKIETMSDALTWAVKKHGNAPIMGTREIIAELDEVQPNGRMFKKYNLGDYR